MNFASALFLFKRDECQTCLCRDCKYRQNMLCENCYQCKKFNNHIIMSNCQYKKNQMKVPFHRKK